MMWILTTIALMILLLAITNFVNLYIADGERRMLEIGIRKVNGAGKREVSLLFLVEVASMVLLALVMGIVVAISLTPHFAQLIGTPINIELLHTPMLYVALTVMFIVTVGLSFAYPALYLSKFSPMEILGKRMKFARHRLISLLIVFQSVVTIVLLGYILVVNSQTTYLRNQPLGYNTKGIATVTLSRASYEHTSSIYEELKNITGIKSVAVGEHNFGGGCSGQTINNVGSSGKSINEYRLSAGVCTMLGLEFVEGKDFDSESPEEREIILNEAAARMLEIREPILENANILYKGRPAVLVGVVKDFHYEGLGDVVQPLALSRGVYSPYLYIEFEEGLSRGESRDIAVGVISKFDPDYKFSGTWLEDIYNSKFRDINTHSKIMLWATALAVFISMLGLFAIHSLSAIRRRREIALRRINGAQKSDIFILMSTNVLVLILVAGLIAAPIVWIIGRQWLSAYSYRAELSVWVFIVPILIQMIIALITVSGITWQVATRNPVESIKTN